MDVSSSRPMPSWREERTVAAMRAVVFAYENGIVEPGKVIPPQDG